MTWLKKDDRYPEHRKIRRLSDGAYRLHDTALCWAAKDETDGFISDDDLDEMQHGRKLRKYVPELVRACLWEPVAGGWTIHDFLHYNPSHQQLEAERAAARDRQARHRARKKGVNTDESPDSNAVTNGVTNGDVTRESHQPVPYRTVPYRTEPDKSATTTATATAESAPKGAGYPVDFLAFWDVYPLKRDKKAALSAFLAAKKRATVDAIIAGAMRYRDDPNREAEYTKYAERWLKADCWDDEPLPVRATQLSRSGSFFQAELARIEQQEREQRRGNVIPLQLGAGA